MLYNNKDKCLSAHPDFIYDEACLDIISDRKANISEQYEACVNCPMEPRATLDSFQKHISLLVNTNYRIKFMSDFGDDNCSQILKFREHSRYVWNLTNEKCPQITITEAADSAYLPILAAIIILLCFGTLWYMIKCIYKCVHNQRYFFGYFGPQTAEDDEGVSLSAPLIDVRIKHPFRVKSLDVFRGFIITIMIFVNYGGGKYWFFHHSVWNGLTIADLVFPWFVWIMGMSLYISLRSRLRNSVPKKQIALQVFYRSTLLVLIGLILNSHGEKQSLDELRFPGVLQRLGIVYLFVGMLEIFFANRGYTTENPRFSWANDITVALPQWLIIFIIVVIHTCITFLLDVNGCPRGYLGPGGIHDEGKYQNCTGGAAGYIDRVVFGKHLYKINRSTFHKMYETTVLYDPEGILGTLTTILTAYMGVQAGRILKKYPTFFARIIRWVIWALVTGLIAGFLCNFSINDGVIPINKNLWSLSYALVLSSSAFLIEGALHFIIDISHKWGGRPFFYPGMNSILLYIGHVTLKKTFPFDWQPTYETHTEYLAIHLWGTFLLVAISIYLYKKNIFFKI